MSRWQHRLQNSHHIQLHLNILLIISWKLNLCYLLHNFYINKSGMLPISTQKIVPINTIGKIQSMKKLGRNNLENHWPSAPFLLSNSMKLKHILFQAPGSEKHQDLIQGPLSQLNINPRHLAGSRVVKERWDQ